MKRGYVLVFFQFLLLALIFVTGPNIPKNIFLLGLFSAGLIVGILAVWNMRVSKLRVNPEIANGSKLVTDGIYKYIRHPMYLGLLLIALSLVLNYFTFPRIIFFDLLVLNQLIKLSYEEKLLEKHFKDYKEYQKRTKKLIPYIY
jgi:protein-S-isoprenylcysteine O-methyltransferase Ste14